MTCREDFTPHRGSIKILTGLGENDGKSISTWNSRNQGQTPITTPPSFFKPNPLQARWSGACEKDKSNNHHACNDLSDPVRFMSYCYIHIEIWSVCKSPDIVPMPAIVHIQNAKMDWDPGTNRNRIPS